MFRRASNVSSPVAFFSASVSSSAMSAHVTKVGYEFVETLRGVLQYIDGVRAVDAFGFPGDWHGDFRARGEAAGITRSEAVRRLIEVA
jgi:hypothetical protein